MYISIIVFVHSPRLVSIATDKSGEYRVFRSRKSALAALSRMRRQGFDTEGWQVGWWTKEAVVL